MTIIMCILRSRCALIKVLYIPCQSNEKAVGMLILILTICGSEPIGK